jgi:hypothetical protein
MSRHILEVKYDKETDDHYIQFDDEMLKELGWKIGDTLVWKDNEDGSYTISKKVDHQPGDQAGDA